MTLVHQLLEELGASLDPCATSRLNAALRARRIGPSQFDGPTVSGLCNAYQKFADAYYHSRDSDQPKEANAISYALRPLRSLFGRTRAADFGPRRFKEVREAMIAKGWCRNHVNTQTGRIKRMFKWAVSNELVPENLHHALQSVDGLRIGRTSARESEPVKPVPEEMVEAVYPFVASNIVAMIKLQLLTGMRPGEVTIMRTCDIDQSANPWTYKPEHHKTQQHGHERFIILGPKAQEIVRPFLNAENPTAYVFSPAASDAERRRKLHEARKTPMSCGNRPGTNRKRCPKRKPGERYDTQAYGHAIRYGCQHAFPAPDGLDEVAAQQWRRDHIWHPHQLRHNAATRLRKEYGLEVAQVVLGHKTLAVTQVYAERDVAAAQKVMLQAG